MSVSGSDDALLEPLVVEEAVEDVEEAGGAEEGDAPRGVDADRRDDEASSSSGDAAASPTSGPPTPAARAPESVGDANVDDAERALDCSAIVQSRRRHAEDEDAEASGSSAAESPEDEDASSSGSSAAESPPPPANSQSDADLVPDDDSENVNDVRYGPEFVAAGTARGWRRRCHNRYVWMERQCENVEGMEFDSLNLVVQVYGQTDLQITQNQTTFRDTDVFVQRCRPPSAAHRRVSST